MAKDPYKNARYYLDESIAATKKLLQNPYGGRQTGSRAKDMSQNEDKGSRMAKTGVGDIPVDSWLRGGGRGGESKPGYDKTGSPPRSPSTQKPGATKAKVNR